MANFRTRKTARLIRNLVFLSGIILLGGCSSDGGGSNDGAATGTFVDSAVIGIEYQTPTQSGITNDRAEFRYQPGEQVTFKIGDLVLGTAPGGEMITPVDLVAGATGTDNQTVRNLLIFLQSLDADADPSDGIEITAAVREAIAGAGDSLDFSADPRSFSMALDSFFQSIGYSGGVIWGEQQAVDNFLAAMDAMGNYWAGGMYVQDPDAAVFLSEAEQAGNGYGYFQDLYASDGVLESGEFFFRTFYERYFHVRDVYGIMGPAGESFFSVSMTNAELDFALTKAVGADNAILSGNYGIVVFTPKPEPYSAYIEVTCNGNGTAAGNQVAASDQGPGDAVALTYTVDSNGALHLNVEGELYRGAVAQDGDVFFFVGENSSGSPEMGIGIRKNPANDYTAAALDGFYYAGVLLRGELSVPGDFPALIVRCIFNSGNDIGYIYGCTPSESVDDGTILRGLAGETSGEVLPHPCNGNTLFSGELQYTLQSDGTMSGTSTVTEFWGGGSEDLHGVLSPNGNYFVLATTSGAHPGIVIGIKDTYTHLLE